MTTCPNCQTVLPAGSVACFACGQALNGPVLTARAVSQSPRPAFCAQCGGSLTTTASVCPACGAPVQSLTAGDQAKSKLVAALLGIFLGGLGVHRFYLGYTTIGVVQILVSLVTCGAGSVWGLIEGILIVAGVGITADAQGRPLKD